MYANGEPAPRIEGLSPVHNVQEINVGRHDILSTDSARCSLSNKSVTPSLVFPLAALHHDAILLALRWPGVSGCVRQAAKIADIERTGHLKPLLRQQAANKSTRPAGERVNIRVSNTAARSMT